MELVQLILNQRELEGVSPRRKRRKLKLRRLRSSGSSAIDRARAARQFRILTAGIQRDLRLKLFPLLRRLEADYLLDSAGVRIQDDFADEIQAVLDEIRKEHLRLAEFRAELVAMDLTKRVNERNRGRFFASVEGVIGINLAGIVDESGIGPLLKLKTAENVNLIKSISEEYLGKVEKIVYESVIQGRTTSKSLIQELVELGGITNRRARFIARDQTAKLTAALNRERNLSLGIVEYFWRTSKDERVRKTHRAHGKASDGGKRYRWDSPPADTGHPGEDFQCRCTAEPIIVV